MYMAQRGPELDKIRAKKVNKISLLYNKNENICWTL